MSILQQAIKTYDANLARVGECSEDGTGKAPLAPIAHKVTKADIEITITYDGTFVSAQPVAAGDEKTIIPVTEKSAARQGNSAKDEPHPLCDKLSYMTGDKTPYIKQLEEWCNSEYSHPKAKAVLSYVKSNDIIADLNHEGIKFKESSFIRWRFAGNTGTDVAECWKDKELFSAFTKYYLSSRPGKNGLCLVTGENVPIEDQHEKAILPLYGSAKLISSSDKNGFTYRGRFDEECQAAEIGYVASQKAHNALRWLISNQSTCGVYGGRPFLCWNPDGIKTGPPMQVFYSSEKAVNKPSDYKKQLAATLIRRKADLQLKGNEQAVIVSFDAATTGRLAITYYNEMSVESFLERLCNWDAHCCWSAGPLGIRPPSIYQLANCAYGTERTEKGITKLVTDDSVLKIAVQELLACRLNAGRFPEHIRAALVQRAGNPQCYEPNTWRNVLHAACSAINMTTYQRKGEEAMAWSLDRPDRSFQFGRLLAVMERAEEDYYYTASEQGRQSNAIKMLSVFRQHPWTIYEQVNRQLNIAYIPRIKPWQKERYQRLKGEIVAIISQFPESEINKPLEDSYLLGYDLQRNAFFNYTKNENNESEEMNK